MPTVLSVELLVTRQKSWKKNCLEGSNSLGKSKTVKKEQEEMSDRQFS